VSESACFGQFCAYLRDRGKQSVFNHPEMDSASVHRLFESIIGYGLGEYSCLTG